MKEAEFERVRQDLQDLQMGEEPTIIVDRLAKTDRFITETKHLEEKIKNIEQDREERKRYANKAFWLVVVYLAVVALILSLSGVGGIPFGFSDSVLITLLSTTTATVIGILVIVMKYLFRDGNPSQA